MCGYRCYFKFDIRNDYCVEIENAERGTLEFIYIMIVDSRECDFENVISRPAMTEII